MTSFVRAVSAFAAAAAVVAVAGLADGSPTRGDWVVRVGSWDDLANGRDGQDRIRLMDNRHDRDGAYPGAKCCGMGRSWRRPTGTGMTDSRRTLSA